MKPSYKKPYYYLHNVNINEEIPTNPYAGSVSGVTATIGGRYIPVDTTHTTPVAGVTYYTESAGTYTAANNVTDLSTGGPYYVRLENTLGEGTDAQDAEYNVHPTPASTTDAIAAANGSVVGEGIANDTFNLPRAALMAGGTKKVSLVEKPTGQRLANASKVRVEIRTGKDDSIFELKSIYIDYIKAPQFIRLTQEQIDLTEDTSQMMEFPDYVCQEIINELTHLIMENSSDPRLQSHMPITMSIANPAQG